jgi:two-component system, response regulator RegA
MHPRMIGSVLVVDDDESLLRNAKRALGASRRVMVACDPAGALEIARRELVDLAFVDVYLRDRGGGFELVPELRRLHPNAHVVMMSGLFCAENTRAAYRAGAHDCIDKMFAWHEVVERVERGARVDSERGDLPSIEQVKHDYYVSVVSAHGGNISAAARTLGIRRRSLQRILARKRPTNLPGSTPTRRLHKRC